MATTNIINPNILKIFKSKQYLVILQGSRGSGKTFFASELKKIYPDIEICSMDDFFLDKQTEYNKSDVSDAYRYCKQKTRAFLHSGKTVIYNNTNLDDAQLDDIITEAKIKKICPIFLRFLPTWNEEKCVEIARTFHPIIKSQVIKQTIIRDNINMIHFQNRHKLGCFGILSYLIHDIDIDQNYEKIMFTQCSSKIDNLKQKYLEAGYFQEKQKPPKQPILRGIQNPAIIPPIMQLPPSMEKEFIEQRHKVVIETLQKQIEDLQEQLTNLSCSSNFTQDFRERRILRSIKRGRSEDENIVLDEREM
jgi:predicted kinase